MMFLPEIELKNKKKTKQSCNSNKGNVLICTRKLDQIRFIGVKKEKEKFLQMRMISFKCLVYYCLFLMETDSYSVVHVVLEFTILLPQPSECWFFPTNKM